ncbi:MAG: ABC transporter permease [Eubacterium sp.]|nr:ABC transporter permease [Eubacterium sp.]
MAEEKKAPEKQSAFSKFMSMNGASVFVAMLAVMVLFEIVIQIQKGGAGGLVFITPHNIMLIFRSMLYTGIIAFGMTLVMITGNIDLSVGSQLTFLCSVCAIFMISTDNPFIGIVGTLAVGAICGLANGLLVSYLKLNSFITTLGTSSIFTALALMASAGTVLVIPNNCAKAFTAFGTAKIGPVSILIIWFVVVAVILGLLLSKTVFGQQLYVVGSNPVAARFSGIKYKLITTVSYIITGVCCGLAAVVTMANVKSANPQSGSGAEMDVILCVVLGGCAVQGGKGSVWGTVIGVLFYGVLDNGFTMLNLSTYMRWVVMGLIMVFVLSMDALKSRGVKLWKKK